MAIEARRPPREEEEATKRRGEEEIGVVDRKVSIFFFPFFSFKSRTNLFSLSLPSRAGAFVLFSTFQ